MLDVDIEVYIGEQIFVGEEIVVVDDIDEATGTATVKRGCVDTIPVPHAAGTQVWGAPDELLILGDLGEKLGHPYEYGISVVSSAKDVAESDMALAEHTPRARFHSLFETETWRQALSETPGRSSSRSPVSVIDAHSRSLSTCAPRSDTFPVFVSIPSKRVPSVG